MGSRKWLKIIFVFIIIISVIIFILSYMIFPGTSIGFQSFKFIYNMQMDSSIDGFLRHYEKILVPTNDGIIPSKVDHYLAGKISGPPKNAKEAAIISFYARKAAKRAEEGEEFLQWPPTIIPYILSSSKTASGTEKLGDIFIIEGLRNRAILYMPEIKKGPIEVKSDWPSELDSILQLYATWWKAAPIDFEEKRKIDPLQDTGYLIREP